MAKSIVVKFLLVLVLVNVVCWWLNPYNKVPDAQESPRNLYPKRAWPQYVSGSRIPDKKLVVLIGNSQSYGEVDDDVQQIYPAYLKEKFKSANVVVENWSVRGIRTADMELLSSQAIAKGADWIVFVLDMSNFDAPENINLDYPNTDINLLLADTKVRQLMEHSLLRKSYNIEHVLRKMLQRYVPLVSLRNPLYEQLADGLVHKDDEIFVFGNPVSREFNPQIHDFKVMRDKLMHKKINPNFEVRILDEQFRHYMHTATLFDYYLFKRIQGSKTNVLFVWQPLNTSALSAKERKMFLTFRASMEKLNRKLGFGQVDLLNAVPQQGMATISHFNAAGHRLFADTLYQRLKNEF